MTATSRAFSLLLISRQLAVLLMVLECGDILLEQRTGHGLFPQREDVAFIVTALVLGALSLVCEQIDRQIRRSTAVDRVELDGRQHVERQQRDASDARRERIEQLLESQDVPAIVFQPIADLRSGAVVGFEALSRFPTGPPDELFAEAAAVGLGIELELKAIRRALSCLDELPAHTYLSVNASPGTLLDLDFMDTVLTVDCTRIVVELTEHVAIEDYEAIREVIARLRATGLRLAVDDVGAGYSSLRHIAMLEPDIIKIDRSFTHALTSTAGDRSVVAALVGFGQSMGATIVAEGIEDAQGLAVARQLGVQAGQGWHIGMPAALAALPALPCPRPSLDARLVESAAPLRER